MASWTYVVQANRTARLTRARTLCDFPLLIGEILRRSDLRLRRQSRRRARIRKIRVCFLREGQLRPRRWFDPQRRENRRRPYIGRRRAGPINMALITRKDFFLYRRSVILYPPPSLIPLRILRLASSQTAGGLQPP